MPSPLSVTVLVSLLGVVKVATVPVTVGTGAEAKKGATVYVNYVGVLWKNGKEFDSSWKRNEPFSFTLGTGAALLLPIGSAHAH